MLKDNQTQINVNFVEENTKHFMGMMVFVVGFVLHNIISQKKSGILKSKSPASSNEKFKYQNYHNLIRWVDWKTNE